MLSISAETLAFIIAKARQSEAEVPPVDPASGSNPSDDGGVDILEDTGNNPTDAELRSALADLNADEMDELLALVWVGRGDFSGEEWPAALAQAQEERSRGDIANLLDIPLLAEYLESGLAEVGEPLTAADDGLA